MCRAPHPWPAPLPDDGPLRTIHRLNLQMRSHRHAGPTPKQRPPRDRPASAKPQAGARVRESLRLLHGCGGSSTAILSKSPISADFKPRALRQCRLVRAHPPLAAQCTAADSEKPSRRSFVKAVPGSRLWQSQSPARPVLRVEDFMSLSYGDRLTGQAIWGFYNTPKGSIQYEHLWFECNRLIANCIHLLQRHAPLSTCWRTMRAVAARRGISETGFRCRMATLQSIRTQRVS